MVGLLVLHVAQSELYNQSQIRVRKASSHLSVHHGGASVDICYFFITFAFMLLLLLPVLLLLLLS